MGSNGRQRPEPFHFHVTGYRLAYGFASLSCTLPIFLAVVGASLTASGPGGMAVMFAAYAAVRCHPDPAKAWHDFRSRRDRLFRR
jgi:hypothetical protein